MRHLAQRLNVTRWPPPILLIAFLLFAFASGACSSDQFEPTESVDAPDELELQSAAVPPLSIDEVPAVAVSERPPPPVPGTVISPSWPTGWSQERSALEQELAATRDMTADQLETRYPFSPLGSLSYRGTDAVNLRLIQDSQPQPGHRCARRPRQPGVCHFGRTQISDVHLRL